MTSEDVEPLECPDCETQFLQEIDPASFPVAKQAGEKYFQCQRCGSFLLATANGDIIPVEVARISPENIHSLLELL